MKFHELAYLAEQTLPVATQANPVYSYSQQQFKPNQGGTPIPAGLSPDDPQAIIGNILNSLVNPVQVAIDSYNLGTTIADAYSQYSSDPTPANALGFLAVAGLGILTIKGGSVGREVATSGRVAAAKVAADNIKRTADEAGKLAATTEYLRGIIKFMEDKPALKELSKRTNIPLEGLEAAAKTATSKVDTAVKGAEKAIDSTPLKTSYETSLERLAKTPPTTPTATPGAGSIPPPSPTAPKTAAPGDLKSSVEAGLDRAKNKLPNIDPKSINWDIEPWASKLENLNRDISVIAKSSGLRGKDLAEHLKDLDANPEIANIAKKNGLTTDQMNSFLDYSFGATPKPVTPAVATAPVSSTSGATKLRSKTPTAGPYRAKEIPPTPGVKKSSALLSTAMPTPTAVKSPVDIINNLKSLGIDLNNSQAANILKAIGADPSKRMNIIKTLWSLRPSNLVYNFLTNTTQGRLLVQTIPGLMAGAGVAAAVGTAGGLTSGQIKAQERQNKIQKLQQAGFTSEQIKRMFPGAQ